MALKKSTKLLSLSFFGGVRIRVQLGKVIDLRVSRKAYSQGLKAVGSASCRGLLTGCYWSQCLEGYWTEDFQFLAGCWLPSVLYSWLSNAGSLFHPGQQDRVTIFATLIIDHITLPFHVLLVRNMSLGQSVHT